MKKMTKKWDLEASNEETEPKIGIYVKNWAKQAPSKIFDLSQSQRVLTSLGLTSQGWCGDVVVNGV